MADFNREFPSAHDGAAALSLAQALGKTRRPGIPGSSPANCITATSAYPGAQALFSVSRGIHGEAVFASRVAAIESLTQLGLMLVEIPEQ